MRPTCLLVIWFGLDKAPRLSISNDIWILSSDTICQLNQVFSSSEEAMMSKQRGLLHTYIKVLIAHGKGNSQCCTNSTADVEGRG